MWVSSSWNLHVTVSPKRAVTSAGVKDMSTASTVIAAAADGDTAVPGARQTAAANAATAGTRGVMSPTLDR